MNRVQRSILTAVSVIIIGGGFAAFAWQQMQSEPEKIRIEREGKRLFQFGLDHARSGSLHAKGAHIEFELNETAGWVLTHPIMWPADKEALEAAINQMAALSYQSITVEGATPQQLAEYGLDKPNVELTVTLDDGSKNTLLVGAQNELQAAYYVTTGAKTDVYLVSDAFYWALDRDLFAFRNKRLLNVSRDAITKVQVREGSAVAYQLQKGADGTWKVGTDQPNLVADPVIVDKLLLWLARDFKADSIVTDELEVDVDEELAAYGVLEPVLRLEVTNEAEHTFAARFGLVDAEPPDAGVPEDGGVGDKRAYVLVEGTRTIAQVYPKLIEDLRESPQTLRDRTIAKFDAEKVARLDLLLFDGSFVKVHKDGERWIMDEPVKGLEAKPWLVQELIMKFSRLRSDEVYQDDVSDKKLHEWLLDPPQRKLAFFDAEGGLIAEVRIGTGLDEDRTFIKNAEGRRVDLLKNPRLKLLPTSAKDFEYNGS